MENKDEINGMAENSVSETPKKRLKVGYLFLAIVPSALIMMIQTVVQFPFLIMSMLNLLEVPGGFTYEALMDDFNEKYAAYVYIIYAVIGVIVFALWYYKGFVKKNPKVRLGDVFSPKSILAVLGFVIGLFFAINAFLILVDWFLPSLMDSYNELVEMSGVITNPVVTLIYGVILGPILEELCFRGVMYSLLEKSGVKVFWVILIQSLFFGAMHIVLVQVLYAAILGLFLGYLRYRYRSITITVLMHILFNLMGTFIGGAIEKLGFGDGVMLILGGIAHIAVAFTIVLIRSDKKAYRP